MKQKFLLLITLVMCAVAAFAQGYPTKKVAEFKDGRACRYFLVRNADFDGTGIEDVWILQKVSLNGSSVRTISNPYDIEGMDAVKDAKLIGDNLYVINTSYRAGDNLACLNTRTGKWTNPIPHCSQCKFLTGNKLWVSYSHPRKDGRGYTFTEKTIILK